MEIPRIAINDNTEFIDTYNNQRTLADVINEILDNLNEGFKDLQYKFYSDELNHIISNKLEWFKTQLEPIEHIFCVNIDFVFEPEKCKLSLLIWDTSGWLHTFLSMDEMKEMKATVDYEIPKIHFR